MKRHFLLDVDGVLADFASAALDRLNAATGQRITLEQYVDRQMWAMEKVYGIELDEFWRIIECGDNFWNHLQPFPWACDLLERLRRMGEVTFATTPSLNPVCAAQKLEWLERYFGVKSDSVMIGARKWLMARPGNILLDDYPANVDLFRSQGGKAILLPSNWNTHPFTYAHVEEFLP